MNLQDVFKDVVGYFDGEGFISEDGAKSYIVPANYASKSKLVEDDRMRLYIMKDGTLIYKQIEPAPRRKFIGTVGRIKNRSVIYGPENEVFSVLNASVQYFGLKPGDTVSCICAEKQNPEWATINNLIERADLTEPEDDVEYE